MSAALPRAAAPLLGFARLLRHYCFPIAPEQIASFMRRGIGRLDALVEHSAGGGVDDAGDDLGQRRLAGAVLAKQRVDLALPEIEADVLDRRHAAIGLGDVLQPHDRVHQAPPGPTSMASTQSPPLEATKSLPSFSATLQTP